MVSKKYTCAYIFIYRRMNYEEDHPEHNDHLSAVKSFLEPDYELIHAGGG